MRQSVCVAIAAVVVGMHVPTAGGITIMDDNIDISFSVYNDFGPNANGGTFDVTSPPAPADRIFSGENALRMVTLDDHVFTGSGELAEMQILGADAEATDEERDMSQFDNPDGTTLGTAYLRFVYRVVRLDEHRVLPQDDKPDVGGVQGNEDVEVTPLDVFPNVRIDLRYFDGSAEEGGSGNDTIASTGENIELINDNQWNELVVPMNVLTAAQRADTNGAGLRDPDIATVLLIDLPNLGGLGNDNADPPLPTRKVTYDIFFDKFEIFAEDPTMQTVPGDADGDGDVDAFDLGIWQTQFGMTGDGLTADFDGDGDVDAFDLGLWQTNFGTGVSGAAVPEPASLGLALLGLASIVRRRR